MWQFSVVYYQSTQISISVLSGNHLNTQWPCTICISFCIIFITTNSTEYSVSNLIWIKWLQRNSEWKSEKGLDQIFPALIQSSRILSNTAPCGPVELSLWSAVFNTFTTCQTWQIGFVAFCEFLNKKSIKTVKDS